MNKKFLLLVMCIAASVVQASQSGIIPVTKEETEEEVSYLLFSQARDETLTACYKKLTNSYHVSLVTNNPNTPLLLSPWVSLIAEQAAFEAIFNQLAQMYQEKELKMKMTGSFDNGWHNISREETEEGTAYFCSLWDTRMAKLCKTFAFLHCEGGCFASSTIGQITQKEYEPNSIFQELARLYTEEQKEREKKRR